MLYSRYAMIFLHIPYFQLILKFAQLILMFDHKWFVGALPKWHFMKKLVLNEFRVQKHALILGIQA